MDMRVLIVEDDADSAESLRRVLLARTDVKYSVVVASTVKSAIECLATDGKTDAILLDLSLPDGQGTDVVSRIAAAAPKAAIMVLTGWAGPEVAEPAKAAGADEVVIKPGDPREINRKLQYLVINRRAEEAAHPIENLLAELGKPLMRVREIVEQKAEKITDAKERPAD